jgi:hypothetical protein
LSGILPESGTRKLTFAVGESPSSRLLTIVRSAGIRYHFGHLSAVQNLLVPRVVGIIRRNGGS